MQTVDSRSIPGSKYDLPCQPVMTAEPRARSMPWSSPGVTQKTKIQKLRKQTIYNFIKNKKIPINIFNFVKIFAHKSHKTHKNVEDTNTWKTFMFTDRKIYYNIY